jgi:AcrR family transcriptional regulator
MPYPAQIDRERLLAAAEQLIESGDAAELSLNVLASALGVKAPSLYRYVAGRDALLQAVNARTITRLFDAYGAALDQAGGDTLRELVAVLHAHRMFAHANPRTYMLAFTTSSPAQRPDPAQLVQLVLPLQARMAALVGAEHSLTALRGALALVHGFVMLELNSQLQRGGDLNAAFAASVEAYLAGWSTPKIPA